MKILSPDSRWRSNVRNPLSNCLLKTRPCTIPGRMKDVEYMQLYKSENRYHRCFGSADSIWISVGWLAVLPFVFRFHLSSCMYSNPCHLFVTFSALALTDCSNFWSIFCPLKTKAKLCSLLCNAWDTYWIRNLSGGNEAGTPRTWNPR